MRQDKLVYRRIGFQMLTKEAQRQLMHLEYGVIGLMILIGIGSIVWSMSLHILSGDLYNMFIGAKVAFRERDFSKLDTRSKLILQDCVDLLNRTNSQVGALSVQRAQGDGPTSNMFVMPPAEPSSTTTTAPKVRKIAHLFRIGFSSPQDELLPSVLDQANVTNVADSNSTLSPISVSTFDAEADYRFLANMAIDIHQTRWQESAAVQFIYGFPLWSEIVAIIWIGMCLIYQSGVKKYWGLPKPWRIVIPSMLVFGLMVVGSLIYTILAQRYIRSFCTQLRSPLSNPDAVSCGQAISVLRPTVRRHVFKHDVYLNMFQASYMLNLVCWALALMIVACRYMLAIDFNLVDVAPSYDEPPGVPNAQEYVEVLLSSPQHRIKVPRVEASHRSEDDFQSAKSHLSEVATPLLEEHPRPSSSGSAITSAYA